MHPLLDTFERNAAKTPDRTLFGDQSLVLDYRRLHAVAAGLAGRIRDETSLPRVGVMAPTSSACAAAIFACWYAGRIPVPLNYLLGPNELMHVVRDAGLDCVLTISHFVKNLTPTGLKIVELDAQTMAPGKIETPNAADNDTAVIIYTSGTSGKPKGVCLSFGNIVQNARAGIEHARMDADQVFLSIIPQFHSFGFTIGTIIPPLLGASAWYLPRFSPAALVATIAEKRATIFIAIASMYGALAKMKNADPHALASLKLAISGGEPLPQRVAQAFRQRFEIDIMEGYGMTESSPCVACNTPWAQRPGSVGRPLPDVKIHAVDSEGRTLAADEIGELVIHGHCVMQGYFNLPEATEATIRDGGLFTGDMGRVDADGFVYVTGRAKEMLIVGGENVFPAEIEAVLCEHPAVAEAAVIGLPDDVRGELPLAYVILKDNAEIQEQDLRAFCREKLAGYKTPREIRFAEDLPHGPTGKILKRALPVTPEP